MSLAVISPNTLYVCDWASNCVCVVDVTLDRVTARLHNSGEERADWPYHTATLGDTILVRYNNLVMYQHGISVPIAFPRRPLGLRDVFGLTTDHHCNFLLVGSDSTESTAYMVYVLDISGNLTHTIPIPGNREPRDCTVVGGQLWVGCNNGDILVFSSQ